MVSKLELSLEKAKSENEAWVDYVSRLKSLARSKVVVAENHKQTTDERVLDTVEAFLEVANQIADWANLADSYRAPAAENLTRLEQEFAAQETQAKGKALVKKVKRLFSQEDENEIQMAQYEGTQEGCGAIVQDLEMLKRALETMLASKIEDVKIFPEASAEAKRAAASAHEIETVIESNLTPLQEDFANKQECARTGILSIKFARENKGYEF